MPAEAELKRFGSTPLADGERAPLAHTWRLPRIVLRKGGGLDAAMIERLREAGINAVIAARLDDADVGEDIAAVRLAEAIAGSGLRLQPRSTGGST